MKISDYINGIQHLGVPTDDMEKSIAFYTGLGFEAALRTFNQAAGEAVAFLRLRNLTIEIYQNNSAVGRPGAIDHVALDVADIEAVFKAAQSGGYVLLDKNIQFLPFWEHGVRFFTILGPNGEKVEFSQMM